MEDSGKHRFYGLEHDSKTRLFQTHSHASTRLRRLGKKFIAENRKRATEDGKRTAQNPGQLRNRQNKSYHVPREGTASRGERGQKHVKIRREVFVLLIDTNNRSYEAVPLCCVAGSHVPSLPPLLLPAYYFFFFFFSILRRIRKNKALAHHTSTYFHTRRVSI